MQSVCPTERNKSMMIDLACVAKEQIVPHSIGSDRQEEQRVSQNESNHCVVGKCRKQEQSKTEMPRQTHLIKEVMSTL